MSKSPLEVLSEAGATGLDRLPDAQRAVFEGLSPEELRVARAIQERLTAAAPEVEGHANNTNNLC